MLRKRIIFTLLFSDNSFVLSRNFRLQRVGDYAWLEKNYCFSKVSQYIDELVVLDVTRGEKDYDRFADIVTQISSACFVPVAVGGGINTVRKARGLMNAGADKIVINTCLFNKDFIRSLASTLGSQSIVGSIDVLRYSGDELTIVTHNAERELTINLERICSEINNLPLGEIYINSVANDGTGIGLDLRLVELIGDKIDIPIIIAGGIGNKFHITEGLKKIQVNAVGTAHLFNFIGDGLKLAREFAFDSDVSLARWPSFEGLYSCES